VRLEAFREQLGIAVRVLASGYTLEGCLAGCEMVG